jgi:2-oxoglutarate ferredoxin oxidoreductase subunit beta
VNDLPAIDICALAIQVGATFVGRSFSGDKKQLSTMLKAAMSHQGTVLLDVISPCVTFNDHEGSTKSYKYMMEHQDAVGEVGFVPYFDDITVEYDHDTTVDVQLHDGSHLRLRKLHEDYDPTDKVNAIKMLTETHDKGVFYVDTQKQDFATLLNMVDEPLATLPQERVRPGRDVLAKLMDAHL